MYFVSSRDFPLRNRHSCRNNNNYLLPISWVNAKSISKYTPINSVSFALWKFWIKYSESTWCTKSGVWSELSTSTNIAHTSLVIIIYRSFNCLRKLKSSYYLRHYERWWSLFIFLWFHKWNLPTQEMQLQIKLFKADTMRSIKFVISLRSWIVLFIC